MNGATELGKNLYKTITGEELMSFPMTLYMNKKDGVNIKHPGYQPAYSFMSELFKVRKSPQLSIDERAVNNLSQLFKKDFKIYYTISDQLQSVKELQEIEEKKSLSLTEMTATMDKAVHSLTDVESFDFFLKQAGFMKYRSSNSQNVSGKDSLMNNAYLAIYTASESIVTAAVSFMNIKTLLDVKPGSVADKNVQTYLAKQLLLLHPPQNLTAIFTGYCKKHLTLLKKDADSESYTQRVKEKQTIDSQKGLVQKAGIGIGMVKSGILINNL